MKHDSSTDLAAKPFRSAIAALTLGAIGVVYGDAILTPALSVL
ncbi:hypothetical protein [Novosphingobium sp. AAP83]|nr:hypothetical protein [Novosphingobium sp. AAP83]